MAKVLKNPISVLFGSVLQEIRKKYGTTGTEDIAKNLSITTSAYRMIESGNANLNTSKILNLIGETAIFHSLRYDKVSKLLIGAQILEPQRDSKETMINAIHKLCEIDEEFQNIFYKSDYTIVELFSDEEVLEEFYSDQKIIDATKRFLESALNLNTEKLHQDLENAKEDSLCILQPFISSAFKQYEDAIENMEEMNTIRTRIQELEKDIQQMKDMKLGYIAHKSIEWRNERKFVSLAGVLYSHWNLNDSNLLKNKFRDNLIQLWMPQFKESVYIIVSNNKQEVAKSVKGFCKILKEVYNESEQNKLGSTFETGFRKVKVGVIGENSKIIKNMGLSKDKELWLYKDERYTYGFLTEFMDIKEFNPAMEEGVFPETVILTNKETKLKFEELELLQQQAEFINL